MRKITLILDGGKETEQLLNLVLEWKVRDQLNVQCVLYSALEATELHEALLNQALHPNGIHTQPAVLQKFGMLQMASFRQADPGNLLSILEEESHTSDLLVMGKSFFSHRCLLLGPGFRRSLHCPIYLPGLQRPGYTLLYCENQAVKQYLQLLSTLMNENELTLLSVDNPSGMPDQKKLIRYVQSYVPRPGFYHTSYLDERDLNIVLKPNTLIVLPLEQWTCDGPLMRSLMEDHPEHDSASVFLTL